MSKTVKIDIRLEPELKEFVRQQAEQAEVTMSQVVVGFIEERMKLHEIMKAELMSVSSKWG